MQCETCYQPKIILGLVHARLELNSKQESVFMRLTIFEPDRYDVFPLRTFKGDLTNKGYRSHVHWRGFFLEGLPV